MTWEPDYVTVSDLKGYLRVTDTDDDAFLPLWITTASRAVDNYCHRQFGNTGSNQTRQYASTYDHNIGCWVAEIDDVMDTDDMSIVDVSGNEIIDYELGPLNAAQKGKPFERVFVHVQGTLTIDAVWGWTTVPVAVKSAAFLQAARLAARRDSPFGVAGSPTEGSEVRLLATLDPDLKTSLGAKYRREIWAA